MQSLISLKGLASGLLLAGIASAAPALEARLDPSCNTATDRACWTDDFDINSDYETDMPTGSTVTYQLEVSQIENFVGPDGVTKEFIQAINGQVPGPTIYANWGDTIVVNVTNSLPNNG